MTSAMSRPRRIVVAALAAAVTMLVALPAPPARAAGPAVDIDAPAPSNVKLTGNPVTVAVRASMDRSPGPDGALSGSMRIQMQPAGEPAGRTAPGPYTEDVTGKRDVSVTWRPTLPYNGKYTVVVEVTGREFASSRDDLTTISRDFFLEVPPVAPDGVVAAANSDTRKVTVGWNANPEPDVVLYVVERAFASGSFAEVGTVTVASGANVPDTYRFVDDLGGSAGGEYKYRVTAVRRAANPSEGVASPQSKTATVRMRAASTTTTTTAGSGSGTDGGSGGGTTATTRKGPTISKSGRVDLSNFEASLPQRQRVVVPGDPGDPGFDPELPFDQQPEVADDGEPVGEATILREAPAASEADSNAALLFVAAGLLVTVLLMHVLWLKSEVDRVPLEAVSPNAE